MISIEGYKAFRGTLQVTPRGGNFNPVILNGEFLYRPDTECWYHKGSSYPADICEVVNDEDDLK